jgi:hypothetical protein
MSQSPLEFLDIQASGTESGRDAREGGRGGFTAPCQHHYLLPRTYNVVEQRDNGKCRRGQWPVTSRSWLAPSSSMLSQSLNPGV